MTLQNSSNDHSQSNDDRIAQLFREHYSMLCNDVNKLLRDESLSEDLVQEVFIKVWEKQDEVEITDRFIYYLKRSCYHAALKYLGSKTYQLETDSNERIATSQQTDETILSRELHEKIQLAIASLPEKTQLIFTLSRYEELSYKQIAEQLNLSVKSIEKHMGKALQQLRVSLNEHLTTLLLIIFVKFL